MHDLAVAGAFILIVISPCLVAARTGIATAIEPKDYYHGIGEEEGAL